MLRGNSFAGVPALMRFRARQIQVAMQSIEGSRGKPISPFFEFRLTPISVQADNIIGKVLGKRQPVLTFANQDVANTASRRTVVDVAARCSVAVEIDHEHFAVILEVRPIIPSLARFKLGMSSTPSGGYGRVDHLVIRWVVIKNSLAGLASDEM